MSYERFNKTIVAISLETPSGCMGEAPWFEMRVQANGALEYRGIMNMPRLGSHKGSVNFICFDYIASVVETSGFLQLPSSDYSRGVSTGGETTIVVETNDGKSATFSRDSANDTPLIWAVAQLLEQLLDSAEWGDEAYTRAIEGLKNIDRTSSLVEGRIDYQRRELPESELKRFLKSHLVRPSEPAGENVWIAYRFDNGITVRFLRDSEEYILVAGESQAKFLNFAAFADHLKSNLNLWKG